MKNGFSKVELVSILKKSISSGRATKKALLRLYSFQTKVEQVEGATTESNGVGFNYADAKTLSSFSEYFLRTNTLSEKQLTICKQKLPKYAGQLINNAINEGIYIKKGRKYYLADK